MDKETVFKEIELLKSLVTSADCLLLEVGNKVNTVKELISIEEDMQAIQVEKNMEILKQKLVPIRNELEKESLSIHDIKCDMKDINKMIVELEHKLILLDNDK